MSIQPLPDSVLSALLAEDVPHGDLTTDSLGIGRRPGVMTFRARGPQVVACAEDAARMIELAGGRVDFVTASGRPVRDGTVLVRASGSAAALHRAWKTAQTLMEYAAGIASTTWAMIEASRLDDGGGPAVACTRKTFPGTRAIAAKAVRAGGGQMHRLGLSETLLVFPEHVGFLPPGGLAEAIAGLRHQCPERVVVVEAAGLEAARAAAEAGAGVVQLEKMPPESVLEFVTWLRGRSLHCAVAAAGGVTPRNARAFAQAGADVLVTSAPYFAPPRDVAVTLGPGLAERSAAGCRPSRNVLPSRRDPRGVR